MKSSEQLSKEYEIYFDAVKWKGFKTEKLGVAEPLSLEKFLNDYHEALKKFEALLFDNLMRVEWADRKILYEGKSRKSFPLMPSRTWNWAAKWLYENWVGFGRKMFRSGYNKTIQSYADDFFPNFEQLNGFEHYFEFPYKHITLEFLMCVSQMKDRLALLKEAEEKKMNLPQFHDYVSQFYTDLHIKTGRNFKIYWNRFDPSAPFLGEVFTLAQKLQYRAERKRRKSL